MPLMIYNEGREGGREKKQEKKQTKRSKRDEKKEGQDQNVTFKISNTKPSNSFRECVCREGTLYPTHLSMSSATPDGLSLSHSKDIFNTT